jgi:hypothetical protein
VVESCLGFEQQQLGGEAASWALLCVRGEHNEWVDGGAVCAAPVEEAMRLLVALAGGVDGQTFVLEDPMQASEKSSRAVRRLRLLLSCSYALLTRSTRGILAVCYWQEARGRSHSNGRRRVGAALTSAFPQGTISTGREEVRARLVLKSETGYLVDALCVGSLFSQSLFSALGNGISTRHASLWCTDTSAAEDGGGFLNMMPSRQVRDGKAAN